MPDGAQHVQVVAATTTFTGIAFVCYSSTGATAVPLKPKNLLFINDGAEMVRINMTSSSGANSYDFPLYSGESQTFTAPPHAYYTGCSVVTTSGGGTASVRVMATR